MCGTFSFLPSLALLSFSGKIPSCSLVRRRVLYKTGISKGDKSQTFLLFFNHLADKNFFAKVNRYNFPFSVADSVLGSEVKIGLKPNS